jgi:hypothetical protein
MDVGKAMIKTKGSKLLLDMFQFVGITIRNNIPNNRGVFMLNSNYHNIQYMQTFEG